MLNAIPCLTRSRTTPNSGSLLGLALGSVLLWGLSGCGSSGASTVNPAQAGEALTRISKAVEAKDWKAVESEATAAIESNTLDSVQTEDALLARTQARIESGNLEGAKEDLAFLDNSDSPSKADEILVIKATYQLKSGDKAGAKKSFTLAKKINKKVKAPVGL